MTARSVAHGSFTLTRDWPHSPASVFAAFSDPEKKKKWFGGGQAWTEISRSFDFREGGRETAVGKWVDTGVVTDFDCLYRDIVPPVPGQAGRIVYSYVMHVDGRKISVSQACIEVRPEGAGTRLIVTEYGDFLDGYDDKGSREHGTNFLMDALGRSLET